MDIKTVKTKDFTMRYFSFGSGEKVLVILPGLSITSVMPSADTIAAAYGKFSDEYTVYLFDRREDMPKVYGIDDMARDTAIALEELGLKNVNLFGASQGGMIALLLSINYPHLVAKLAIGSSTAKVGEFNEKILKRWIELAKLQKKEELYLDFAKKIYPERFYEKYKNAFIEMSKTVTDSDLSRFIISASGTKGFDVTEKLKEIKCPVLVLYAADDKVLGGDSAKELKEKLSTREDVTFFGYSGFGHAAFDTAPDYKRRLYAFFE
ncbi:MAG: alpha/beta hydrolase [Clostridia bacterium]|nr:alpha/beta hydrolase [Clostridia bacterium]